MVNKPSTQPPKERRLVFARVQELTGVAFTPEEQTPKLRQAFGLLLAQNNLDRMTRIPQLGHFKDKVMHVLKEQLNTSANETLTMVFCDLNHLGKANHFLGHVCANKLIRDIVNILKTDIRQGAVADAGMVRAPDVPGRHGGDEFVILLRNCDKEMATKRMQSIADKISAHIFSYGEKMSAYGQREMRNIGLSFGCCEIPALSPEQRRTVDLEELVDMTIDAADARMQKYKKAYKQEPTMVHDGAVVWSQAMQNEGKECLLPPIPEELWRTKALRKDDWEEGLGSGI